jgi:hypothetical protein
MEGWEDIGELFPFETNDILIGGSSLIFEAMGDIIRRSLNDNFKEKS